MRSLLIDLKQEHTQWESAVNKPTTLPLRHDVLDSDLAAIRKKLRWGEDLCLLPENTRWTKSQKGQKTLKDITLLASKRRYKVAWTDTPTIHSTHPVIANDQWNEWRTKNLLTITPKTDALVFIGDIHGHLDAAKRIYAQTHPLNPYYIFTGDYVSKGPYPLETLLWIDDTFIKTDKGTLLTGNHELHLEDWLIDAPLKKNDFINTWKGNKQDKPFVKKFLSALHEGVHIQWKTQTFLATHGGIEHPDDTHNYTDPGRFIYGTGGPTVDIDRLWDNKAAQHKIVQVHGHRNPCHYEPDAHNPSVNLEGTESWGEVQALVWTPTTQYILREKH